MTDRYAISKPAMNRDHVEYVNVFDRQWRGKTYQPVATFYGPGCAATARVWVNTLTRRDPSAEGSEMTR